MLRLKISANGYDDNTVLYLKENATPGFDPVYGARPLKRAIQQQVENPLAQEILRGKFKPGDVIRVAVEEDHLDFRSAA